MKVKCVNNAKQEGALTVGREYRAITYSPGWLEVEDNRGEYAPYSADRFVEVDEACPDTQPSLPRHLERKVPSLPPQPTKGQTSDREREMEFFRASCQSHTCDKCGAPTPCNYHPTHPQGWEVV